MNSLKVDILIEVLLKRTLWPIEICISLSTFIVDQELYETTTLETIHEQEEKEYQLFKTKFPTQESLFYKLKHFMEFTKAVLAA